MYYLIIEGDPIYTHEIKQHISPEHFDYNKVLKYPKLNGFYDHSLFIYPLESHYKSVINNINFNLYKVSSKLIEVDSYTYSHSSGKAFVRVADPKGFNRNLLIEKLEDIQARNKRK